MTGEHPHALVLSLYPFSRGFAFVFLDGPESPFEWGVKEIKGTNRHRRTVIEMETLVERFRPEVIVIEEKSRVRRTTRIRKLYRAIHHLAKKSNAEVYRCSKKELAFCFGLSKQTTKLDMAREVSRRIKGFAHKLPSARKPWQSEDPRQSLFDAAALAMTYYRRITERFKSETREKEE